MPLQYPSSEMSRYETEVLIRETELDLLSPFAGFGRQVLPASASITNAVPDAVGSPEPREEDQPKFTKKKAFPPKFWGGWRTGVALGTVGALTVLAINVSLLIWIKAKYHVPNNGSAIVYEGSCSKKTTISVWCHLAINVCSTILLSASNNAMQVLSAPTRADVDKAHNRGLWMDIGILSIKNLRMVGWKRVTLWAILGSSSLPLHLLYNSVITTIFSRTDYMAIMTRETFTDGAAWNRSTLALDAKSVTDPYAKLPMVPNFGYISQLQNNSSGNLRRLENADCVTNYNHEFMSDWRNVLVISNATATANPENAANESAIVYLFTDNVAVANPIWCCFTSLCTQGAQGCDPTWRDNSDFGSIQPVVAQYCLAESIKPHCKVTFNVFMLLIAVVCNAVKAAAFLVLLLLPDFKPLITVGDAVASFLTVPDNATARIGAPTSAEDGSWIPTSLSKPWKPRRCHWFCGASLRQWMIGTISFACIWLPGLIVVLHFAGGSNLKSLWNEGFGAVHVSSIVRIASSTMGTSLVSNSPQLLLSMVYVSFNLILTSMAMTAEYNDFAAQRKPLRVSKPKGQQRSSYYLQLPYRYSVPLIICSGLLHWLLSQSLFPVYIIYFDNAGIAEPDKDISACGWSPIAVVFTLILGGAVVLVLCILGCRKLNVGMPVMRSNSLDIAAACHPPVAKEDMALEPLSYGATNVRGFRSWHASFTNERVVPLTRKYDGAFQVDLVADTGDELDLILPVEGNHKKRISRIDE